MLSLPASVRVFAARERVDFRKGIDGLVQIVRDGFGEDPFAGRPRSAAPRSSRSG